MIRLPVAAGIVAVCVFAFGFAAAQDRPDWKLLASILLDDSGVPDLDGDPAEGQFLSTVLRDVPGADRYILVYQRILYNGARKPESRQIINYTFQWADLDAGTIDLVPWQGMYAEEEFFVVTIRAHESVEFIPYSNLVEQRLKDGTVDLTGSRGRVRQIALGYFTDEETAAMCVESARKLIESAAKGNVLTLPRERPGQSSG